MYNQNIWTKANTSLQSILYILYEICNTFNDFLDKLGINIASNTHIQVKYFYTFLKESINVEITFAIIPINYCHWYNILPPMLCGLSHDYISNSIFGKRLKFSKIISVQKYNFSRLPTNYRHTSLRSLFKYLYTSDCVNLLRTVM